MAEQTIPSYVRGLLMNEKYTVKFKDYLEKNFKELFSGVDGKECNLKIRLDGVFHGYSNLLTHDKFGDPLSGVESVIFKAEKPCYQKEQEPRILNRSSYNTSELVRKKTVIAVVESEDDLIPAIKCILWSNNNNLKTVKDLLTSVMKKDNSGNFIPYLEWVELISKGDKLDYSEINNQINKAVSENELYLTKFRNNGKTVYLYSNPTDKRKGYYYKGKLWKLKELSLINGVKEGTIQKRFQTMSIEQSIR